MRGGNNRNIVRDGMATRFSSTRQPEHNGRKPRLYTVAKKGYNIGYDEFREVVLYLMQLPKAELEDVMSRDETPIWVVNIARAMHKDTGKGVTFTLREMIGHVFGRDGKTDGGGTAGLDLSQLTDEEVSQYYFLRAKAAKNKYE